MKYIKILIFLFALSSCSRKNITSPASVSSGLRSGTYIMDITKIGYQSVLKLSTDGNWVAEESMNGIKVREQSGRYYADTSKSPEEIVIDRTLIYYDMMRPSASTDYIKNPTVSIKAGWYCDNDGNLVVDSEYGYLYKKK
jgi:hypothetical protein